MIKNPPVFSDVGVNSRGEGVSSLIGPCAHNRPTMPLCPEAPAHSGAALQIAHRRQHRFQGYLGTVKCYTLTVSWDRLIGSIAFASSFFAEAIAAIDMCVVPTLTFERLFAFLVLGHGRRRLL